MKNTYNKNHFISLSVMSFLLAGTSCSAIAGDYYPPGLFSIAGVESQLTNEELDVFKENDIAPGKYKVNLFINNNKVSNQDIDFILMKNSTGNKKLAPCFSKADWDNFGIEFPVSSDENQNTDNCLNINNIEFVQGYLDLNTKVYSLTVPQSYLNKDKLSQIEEKKLG
ncbi:FimD/PapC N-terminal domain-containing protein [Morganella psychrotolerans]|uniref:FimD/PapC N-terminal domain-containing protein n=1 Tax=Morganella psychrotolerans TaxID=368603 RepID=UPI000AA129D7|nr:FimD/PapC N-terminal domain-containing protein [Morganella psychrotolerans]